MKILVIEDEKLLADAIQTLLQSKSYEVETVYDEDTGKEYALLGIYDLVILDVMMPNTDGYQLIRDLRAKRCSTPILVLTARSSLEDRIAGLEAGADYCLTKPFDTRELVASVAALLRRAGSQVDEMRFGDIILDLSTTTLICCDRRAHLTAREFDVMRMLMQAAGKNVSKESILTKVWGFESNAVENHVEVYIGFLRKKLKYMGAHVRIINVRRTGYHLEVIPE